MAKEFIDIKLHQSGNGFDIPFKNATISVPDTPGAYCISSGCGSGKTESIKSLIRHKHNQGILYCVDTISECQKMHDWIMSELVGTGVMKADDVVMINSAADFEQMKCYYDKPEGITKVEVLIVVQVRFFIELINFFLLYNPKTPPQAFDGDFGALMSSGELRKYILFDETPLFLKPFATLTKGELAPYTARKNGKWRCKNAKELHDIYNSFIKGDRKMGYNNKKNRLSSIKNEVIISHISRLFDTWMGQNGKEYSIQFYPKDLCQPGMKSHVLLYEGAGDVLLGNTSCFNLLNVQNKYNKSVTFHPFSFGLKRKFMPSDLEYDGFVLSVKSILDICHGKTLVVIWKDFKGSMLTEKADDTYTLKLAGALVALGVDPQKFSVTYYGASDTKSTNAYRDYENIILCGKWNLGPSVISKLRMGFDFVSACMENYMMWYYVQLLLRIGIRNNIPGQKFNVYYSDDHPLPFIFRLNVYLNQNIFIPKKVASGTPLWEAIVKQHKMSSHYLPSIRALVSNNPGIVKHIEKGQTYVYNIKLKDIAILIPRKKRMQKDNYKPLIMFLKKINIILNIQ